MMKTEDWVGAEEKENEQRAGKQHERDFAYYYASTEPSEMYDDVT